MNNDTRLDYSDMEAAHCSDCCCARSWKALGVDKYDGKSIPEHIEQLQAENQRLKDGLKQILVNAHQESKALVDIARRTLNEFNAVQPQKGNDNET